MAKASDLNVVIRIRVHPVLRHLPGIVGPRKRRRFRYWIRRTCDPQVAANRCTVCIRKKRWT